MTKTNANSQTNLGFNPSCHHLLAAWDLGHNVYFTAESYLSFLIVDNQST